MKNPFGDIKYKETVKVANWRKYLKDTERGKWTESRIANSPLFVDDEDNLVLCENGIEHRILFINNRLHDGFTEEFIKEYLVKANDYIHHKLKMADFPKRGI
jgi:hypothetical protein